MKFHKSLSGRIAGVTLASLTSLALMAGCSSNTPASGNNENTSSDSTAAEQVDSATVYPLTISMWDGDGNSFDQTFNEAPKRVIT